MTPMRSLKSLAAGFFYIVILGLTLQLVYMFIAIGYADLSAAYPWIKSIGAYLGYATGIAVFFLLMASGGYITASIAKSRIVIHCCIVGASTTLLSLLSSQNNDELTYLGMLFVVAGIVFTVIGGQYWRRSAQADNGTHSFR